MSFGKGKRDEKMRRREGKEEVDKEREDIQIKSRKSSHKMGVKF